MKLLKALTYFVLAYKAYKVMNEFGAMNFWTYSTIAFAILGILEIIEFRKEKQNG